MNTLLLIGLLFNTAPSICSRHVNPLEHVVPQGIITSEFGPRHRPMSKQIRIHQGIDIAAKKGTPIFPTARGRVVAISRNNGYGKMVTIFHGKDLYTKYAHLHSINVELDQYVYLDTKIGTVGKTGYATGPHLHLEVVFLDQYINPLKLALLHSYLYSDGTCVEERQDD